MAQDRLDSLVLNPKAVKIGCQAAAESMPAMALRPGGVAVELVVRTGMLYTLFLASLLAVESKQNHPVKDVVEIERGPSLRAKHRPGLGFLDCSW